MSNKSNFLFNTIAPIYGLFYEKQKKRFIKVIEEVSNDLDITVYNTVIDIGCGTGALCSVLYEKGLKVTGIDPADKMLRIAKRQNENINITFQNANVLDKLPFEDKSYDISFASYVAHGLQKHERKLMYAEMSRITKAKSLYMTIIGKEL